jgi:hypothetical protein
VTEAEIDIKGATRKSTLGGGQAPILIAASDGLSAIVVASQHSNRVYFFAREDNGLKLLNRKDFGPVVDLDIAAIGNLAVLLVKEGNTLVLVNHPDAVYKRPEQNARTLKAQKRLISQGLLNDAADGILGESTNRAIKLFQKYQGLNETGVLDEETYILLDEEHAILLYLNRMAFEERFDAKKLRYFKPDEFLVHGQNKDCMFDSSFPPKRTWCNAFEVARVMDIFRRRWGRPVIIDTAYLSEDYLRCDTEQKGKAHSDFRAVDFHSTYGKAAEWVAELEKMRDDGLFYGKVKVIEQEEKDMVHLELHQAPELWAYAGMSNNKVDFKSPYLNIDKPPANEQTLEFSNVMNLRAVAPRKKQGDWVKSKEIISLLQQNLALVVDKVAKLDYPKVVNRYWVGGRVRFRESPEDVVEKYKWFVILESHRSKKRALDAALELEKTYSDFSFDVYLRENDWYVIVSGVNLDTAEAKQRVLEARCAGVADDAFMRLSSKDWEHVE